MNYLKFSLVTGGLIALMMGLSGAAMAGSDEEQLERIERSGPVAGCRVATFS